LDRDENFIIDSDEFKRFSEIGSYIITKMGDKENVSELYENIRKVKKERLVSKVTFVDNQPYKIQFHFIKNSEYLLLIKAYNKTDPKCIKEIKISHEKFTQIITIINIEEILPRNVFLTYINSYELLVDKILSHTTYLYLGNKSIKFGLSPKAVGLLFLKKYSFEFFDCKNATVDFIVLKRMHLRLFLINDVVK
jgi:uncharacterized protein involved in tolerance to divalent cations